MPGRRSLKVNVTKYRGDIVTRWRDLAGKQRLHRWPDKETAERRALDIARCLADGRDWEPPGARPGSPRQLSEAFLETHQAGEALREDLAGHLARLPESWPEVAAAFAARSESDLTLDAWLLCWRWARGQAATVPPAPALMPRLARAYLDERAGKLARRTIHRYAEALDLFLAFLAQRDPARSWGPEHFSRDLMLAGLRWLGDPATGRHGRARGASTQRKLLEVWILLWKWAADSDWYGDLTPRPREVELPKSAKRIVRAPEWAETDRMLACLAETAAPWAVRLGILARYLGERRSALLRLRWADVDLERGELFILSEITKGEYGGRRVPLHADLAARLRAWGPSSGPIVVAPAAELTARGHVDRTFRRAWKRAGVRPEVWSRRPIHAFRKGLRTSLVAAGVHQDVIDAYLGHAGEGTGGRDYTDRAALFWPALVPAVATIPRLELPLELGCDSSTTPTRG